MPTYNVLLGLTLNERYEVEAADAYDAAEQASDLFRNDYELPSEGEIVVDSVELTDLDYEEGVPGVSGRDGAEQ